MTKLTHALNGAARDAEVLKLQQLQQRQLKYQQLMLQQSRQKEPEASRYEAEELLQKQEQQSALEDKELEQRTKAQAKEHPGILGAFSSAFLHISPDSPHLKELEDGEQPNATEAEILPFPEQRAA